MAENDLSKKSMLQNESLLITEGSSQRNSERKSEKNNEESSGMSSEDSSDTEAAIAKAENPTMETFNKGLVFSMGLVNKMSGKDQEKAFATFKHLLKNYPLTQTQGSTEGDIKTTLSAVQGGDTVETTDGEDNTTQGSKTLAKRNHQKIQQPAKVKHSTQKQQQQPEDSDSGSPEKKWKPKKDVLAFLRKTGQIKSKTNKILVKVEDSKPSKSNSNIPKLHQLTLEEVQSGDEEKSDKAEPQMSAAAGPSSPEEEEEEYDGPHMVRLKGITLLHQESGNWRCTYCNQLFQFKTSGVNHMRTHINDKQFECSVKGCGRRFKYETNRKRHLKTIHKKNAVLCKICDEDFTNKVEMADHMLAEHGKRIGHNMSRCEECNLNFNTKNSYKSHIKYRHSAVKMEFKCVVCGKVFGFQSNLIRHSKIHTGDRPHKCDYCDSGFIERKSLMMHMMKAHDNPETRAMLDVCQKYKCDICGKEFMNSGNLQTHQRVHSREKPYICSYCTRAFSIKSNLKRHEATHRGERKFPCPDCKKYFTEKRSMQIHYRLHTGEKPYKCDICEKQFAQLGTLNAHKPVHHKERKYKCVESGCGMTFLRASHLAIHQRKHSTAPQLKCLQCEHLFYRKSDLTRHEQIHNTNQDKPYGCGRCGKRFTRKAYLTEHHNTQHILPNTRYYQCQLCRKTFSEKADFIQHQLLHLNSREEVVEIAGTEAQTTVLVLEQQQQQAASPHIIASSQEAVVDQQYHIVDENGQVAGKWDGRSKTYFFVDENAANETPISVNQVQQPLEEVEAIPAEIHVSSQTSEPQLNVSVDQLKANMVYQEVVDLDGNIVYHQVPASQIASVNYEGMPQVEINNYAHVSTPTAGEATQQVQQTTVRRNLNFNDNTQETEQELQEEEFEAMVKIEQASSKNLPQVYELVVPAENQAAAESIIALGMDSSTANNTSQNTSCEQSSVDYQQVVIQQGNAVEAELSSTAEVSPDTVQVSAQNSVIVSIAGDSSYTTHT